MGTTFRREVAPELSRDASFQDPCTYVRILQATYNKIRAYARILILKPCIFADFETAQRLLQQHARSHVVGDLIAFQRAQDLDAKGQRQCRGPWR